MKALRIHKFGHADVMTFDDMDVPEPREDEILIRIHAASLNPVDFKTREGKYAVVEEKDLPLTLGRDVSGKVEKCGAAIDAFGKGDEIYAMLGPERGSFAEYAIVKGHEAAKKPQTLTHTEAAAVPLAALTAWQGLFDHGHLTAGQRVLIHGGGGGVGHFAIQFAREKGAEIFTTVSTADMDFARDLGADHVFDYKNERFEDHARDIDLVFDLVAGETQDRSWAVINECGRFVSTLGQPSEEEAQKRGATPVGYLTQPNGRQLAGIARLIDSGRVRPQVSTVFPFDEVREAEQKLEEEHVCGKVVLDVTA